MTDLIVLVIPWQGIWICRFDFFANMSSRCCNGDSKGGVFYIITLCLIWSIDSAIVTDNMFHFASGHCSLNTKEILRCSNSYSCRLVYRITTFPGFKMALGSSDCLIAFIIFTAPTPY